jgi:dTMP kinase
MAIEEFQHLRGAFITFEGIEGSGKTTQIKLLAEYFASKGLDVVLTKEPGGTRIGTKIRSLILDPETKFTAKNTEVLLFYADRLEHVETVIKPALAEGKTVLCDRYIDSTTAYQIYGREVDPDFIKTLNTLIQLMPVKTILLDMSPEEGLSRAKIRGQLDRFEQEEINFHRRLREGYLKTASQNPDRIFKIPVSGKSVDVVFKEIINGLTNCR